MLEFLEEGGIFECDTVLCVNGIDHVLDMALLTQIPEFEADLIRELAELILLLIKLPIIPPSPA